MDSLCHVQKNGTLPKTQKPRYVGKIDPSFMSSLIHKGEIWKGENNHGPKEPIVSLGVGNITPTHTRDSSVSWGQKEPFL